jgi:methanethiol S-methyltransferase
MEMVNPPPFNLYDHILVSFLWILWCVIHSLLISETFMRYMRTLPLSIASWHRLLYVIVSVLTLLPVVWYQFSIPAITLWEWKWPWMIVQWIGILSATLLFVSAARVYDHSIFFGLWQLREQKLEPALGRGSFYRKGVLAYVRHPYYTAGILVLLFWGDGDSAMLSMRVVGIAYLYVGTLLEERKLVAVFGDAYREYQRDVPMLFPRLIRTQQP